MPLFFLKLPQRRSRPTPESPPATALQFLQPEAANPKRRLIWRWVEVGVALGSVGVGAIVVLPLFLSQAGGCGKMARGIEARSYMGSFNRAQQAYWLENGQFSASLATLGVGLEAATPNYTYTAQREGDRVVHRAIAQQPELENYTGAVFQIPDPAAPGHLTTAAIICEFAKGSELASPSLADGVPVCPAGAVAFPS